MLLLLRIMLLGRAMQAFGRMYIAFNLRFSTSMWIVGVTVLRIAVTRCVLLMLRLISGYCVNVLRQQVCSWVIFENLHYSSQYSHHV